MAVFFVLMFLLFCVVPATAGLRPLLLAAAAIAAAVAAPTVATSVVAWVVAAAAAKNCLGWYNAGTRVI